MLPHLREFIDYITLERGLAKRTVEAYRWDLELFGKFLEEREVTDLSQVTRELIREFLAEEQERGLAEKTIARHLVGIKAFFKFLAVDHLLAGDITEIMNSPKLWRKVPETLSEAECRAVIEVYSSPEPVSLRNRAIMELLYASGLRASECCDLRTVNVNLQEGLLRVVGKGSKERVVPFGHAAAKAMGEYLRNGRPELDAAGKAPFFFLNQHGRRLNIKQVWLIAAEAGTMAGVAKHVHPHLLRHSFATHLLANGADLRVIQDLLGHASINTTQIYTHADTSKIAEAFRKFHPRA